MQQMILSSTPVSKKAVTFATGQYESIIFVLNTDQETGARSLFIPLRPSEKSMKQIENYIMSVFQTKFMICGRK